jgi:hypothetical protein
VEEGFVMRLMVRSDEDMSPCIVRDPVTDIGVPLVPGAMVDTDQIGITDVKAFLKQNGWAFESPVEDASADPGSKRFTKRLP